MRDEDHIGPVNGHTNRGPDIAANGCLWVIEIFFAFVAIFGGYGFYADWRKPAHDQQRPFLPPFLVASSPASTSLRMASEAFGRSG